MFRRMLVLAVTVLVAVSVAPLHALGNATTLLGFAETYTAPDGATRSHRGLDFAMDAGDVVETPLGGEVGFVGRVPGSDGGTVLAVTIVEGSRRLTLLPLEDARVERGDWIDAGTAIGTIAASGDPSSERPHVHVGLRQGEVYVDPAGLFSVAVPAPATKPEAAEAPSPATDGVGAEAAAESAVVSPEAAPVAAGAPASGLAAGGAAVLPHAGAASGIEVQAPNVVTAGGAESVTAASGALADGVSLASSGVGTAANAAQAAPGLGAAAASASAVKTLAPALTRAATSALGAPLGIASCAAAMVGCALLFTRRALVRRLVSHESVSDRLGSMLRALRAGDTLCGLTSCSGHSAFTDPGPL